MGPQNPLGALEDIWGGVRTQTGVDASKHLEPTWIFTAMTTEMSSLSSSLSTTSFFSVRLQSLQTDRRTRLRQADSNRQPRRASPTNRDQPSNGGLFQEAKAHSHAGLFQQLNPLSLADGLVPAEEKNSDPGGDGWRGF